MMDNNASTVVTLRVPARLDQRLTQEAKRRRRTKSALVREALVAAFGDAQPVEDKAREARRQSLLVSGRKSERDALDFVVASAHRRGWK